MADRNPFERSGRSPSEPPTQADNASPDEPVQPWQQELFHRIESFHRRRARRMAVGLGQDGLLIPEKKGGEEKPPVVEAQLPEPPRPAAALDVELHRPSPSGGEAALSAPSSLEPSPQERRTPTAAAVDTGEVVLEWRKPEPAPVEIVVGVTELRMPPAATERPPTILRVAPLGSRFLAGLADTLVLLVAASIFALIFWAAGGRLRPELLNLAVLGLIMIYFVFLYFALFTALTSSTPGLAWMGLEVRNVSDAPPTARESLWRAFGYLVSISALMLGFIWALVDGETLTWHDRMSGTFITPGSSTDARARPRVAMS